MRTGKSYSSTNESVSVRMPLWPSSRFFQVLSASVASAVDRATPVTTTLGRPFPVDNPVISVSLSFRAYTVWLAQGIANYRTRDSPRRTNSVRAG